MKKLYLISVVILLLLVLIGCKSTDISKTSNISTYTRDTSSGTRDAFFSSINFKEAIKDDSVLNKDTLIVDGNGDMITKVVNDINSIGYISLSSYNSKVVTGLNINNIEPSSENVLNGSYILQRGFYYIITKNNTSDADLLAVAFNDYLKTIDAKLIIKSKGGIVDITNNEDTWEDIKSNHPVTLKNNKSVTVRFGGSTSVSSIGQSLGNDFSIKAGHFKGEHNYTGSSAAFTSTQGKDFDTNSLNHIGFSSRPFNDSEVAKENTSGLLSLDAIVAIVNIKNSITNISVENLKNLYMGKFDSWESEELK